MDIVVCEAARRLHTDHKLSFSEIDATGILPRSLVMEYGIIWDPLTTRYDNGRTCGIQNSSGYHRTMLPWPPRSLFNQKSDAKSFNPSEAILSTEQRLSRMSNLMCANLSCIQPACPVHGTYEDSETLNIPLILRKVSVPSLLLGENAQAWR